MIQINWYPSARELRTFAGLWLVFFGVLGGLAAASDSPRAAMILMAVGAAAGLAGLARPSSVRLLYVLWMAATFPIGLLISNLMLLAVFYLVLTPVGLIQRLRGWDPLARRLDAARASYWEPRSRHAGIVRYFRQY